MIVLPKYVIKIMNTQTVLCMVHAIVLIFIPVHLRSTVNLKWQQIVYKIFSLRDTYSYCIMLFISVLLLDTHLLLSQIIERVQIRY